MDNEAKWYILGQGNKQYGKYTAQQMIDWYNQGKLNDESFVACSGMKSWAKFKDTELVQNVNSFTPNDSVDIEFDIPNNQSANTVPSNNTPKSKKKFAIIGVAVGVLLLIFTISSFSKVVAKSKNLAEATKDSSFIPSPNWESCLGGSHCSELDGIPIVALQLEEDYVCTGVTLTQLNDCPSREYSYCRYSRFCF